jgi:CheY-like chemotaxis protein
MADPATPATILIAEDDSTQRSLMADILVQGGYRVLEASDGASALALAREKRPDLVLVDVSMPDMSGWNVVRQLRDDWSLGSINVIMVTGHVDSWDRDASIAAGADSHLTKPVAPELLLSEIKRILRR